MPILITLVAIIVGTLLDEIETGLVIGLIAGVASMQWLLWLMMFAAVAVTGKMALSLLRDMKSS
jgi:hypothetical protein